MQILFFNEPTLGLFNYIYIYVCFNDNNSEIKRGLKAEDF